jgi:hypothetical protein
LFLVLTLFIFVIHSFIHSFDQSLLDKILLLALSI